MKCVTKTPCLTDFPSHILATAKRKKQALVRQFREQALRESLEGYSLLFEHILPRHFLDSIDPTQRDRHFPVPTVFWAWLAQLLEANASCNKALTLIQTWCLTHNLPIPSSGNSGYCQARSKVPLSFLEAVTDRTTSHLAQRESSQDQWRGLTLKAIDGSSVQLCDTATNQAVYPQPSTQKEGCGTPTMGIVGVTNLSTGGWEGFETCGWQKHDARMAPRLLKYIDESNLLLADRAFGSYEFIARVTGERKGHVLMRLHQARFKKLDWRKGEKVSNFERLVEWQKPASQPPTSELTKEQWDALPATMTLRYIRMGYENRSGEKQMLVVVTDLLDPRIHPGEELIELYARRWEIEIKLRDIKTTLGMELMRVKSPEMAHRTLLMTVIAYNLIRAFMQAGAAEVAKPVWHMSFKGVLDLIESSRESFRTHWNKPEKRAELRRKLISLSATKTLDIRPFRSEPRAIKRRPKNYQLLTKPRHLFREIQHRSTYRKSA